MGYHLPGHSLRGNFPMEVIEILVILDPLPAKCSPLCIASSNIHLVSSECLALELYLYVKMYSLLVEVTQGGFFF